jgi:hypothetical protein
MSRLNNLNKFSSCKPIPRKQIWTVSLLLLQKIRRGPLTLLLWTEFGRKSSSDSPYCVYDACRHNNRADPVFRLSTTKLTHSKRNILFSHRHSCFSAVRIRSSRRSRVSSSATIRQPSRIPSRHIADKTKLLQQRPVLHGTHEVIVLPTRTHHGVLAYL